VSATTVGSRATRFILVRARAQASGALSAGSAPPAMSKAKMDLINHLNDALMDVPPEYRHELCSYVVERASATSLAPTRGALDRLIAEGRAHLGIDDALARVEPRRARHS
jgi:hypothetical protein